MNHLFKKGLYMAVSFTVLAASMVFPAYAANTYGQYGFRYYGTAIPQSVPVGAELCFQTPPLKKTEKLYYTVGNGNVLHTFVAGTPIQNADGTVRYRLGLVCRKVGETGVYINWNGKKRMLYSVQVIDDKSKEGFPLRTSFGRIFANQGVEKIVVTQGDTFEKRQTTNVAQINRFLARLAPEGLYRDCRPVEMIGCGVSVDFYLKGQEGYYRYIIGHGFTNTDRFSVPLPTGRCVEENAEEVLNMIGDFYTGLK